jgi:predicted dehydrogenase
VIGAGNYAQAVFLPNVKKVGGVDRQTIVSATGVTASHAAKKFAFQFASSSESDILDNPDINLVAILTRHDQHARQVMSALQNGKHVFCEKPLAINLDELQQVAEVVKTSTFRLMVGFNRRFAPMSRQLHQFLQPRTEPLYAHYRVNAGYLPLNHWLHDPSQGGGRIIEKAGHFIDFLTFLWWHLPSLGLAPSHCRSGKYHAGQCGDSTGAF